MRAIPEFLLIPLLLLILGGSLLVAGMGVLSDLTTWISRWRRSAPPAFTGLFRSWPLVIWGASAALLPDLPVRLAAGAMFIEHVALLFFSGRRQGRVVAGE